MTAGEGYGYVSPQVARLIRVDIDAEKWDAVRAGELLLTSSGSLPIGPLPRYPEPSPRSSATRREPSSASATTPGLW